MGPFGLWPPHLRFRAGGLSFGFGPWLSTRPSTRGWRRPNWQATRRPGVSLTQSSLLHYFADTIPTMESTERHAKPDATANVRAQAGRAERVRLPTERNPALAWS